jgi:hypothetical protein
VSAYAWLITEDTMPMEGAPEGSYMNAKGLTGPSTAPADLLVRLANDEGLYFKMYDDDGEHYYSGRLVCSDPEQEVIEVDAEVRPNWVSRLVTASPDEESAFGPLRDFGTGNSGCTEIRYKDKQNRWGSL